MGDWTPKGVAEWLYELVGPGSVGAEIGVAEGDNCRNLLTFPNLVRRLYAIDPWRYWLAGENEGYGEYDPNNCKDQAAQDSRYEAVMDLAMLDERLIVIRDTSEEAVKSFHPGDLDFAFIDANHGPEHTRQDLDLWWPVIKPRGVLCGHDLGTTQKFLVEKFGNDWASKPDDCWYARKQ